MNQIVINHELNDDKGVFTLLIDDTKAGEMFYKQYGNERIEIKHTEIDPKQLQLLFKAKLLTA